MAKEFVTLTRADFEQWIEGLVGKKYVLTRPKNGREDVIKFNTGIHGLEFHVYTTVDTDQLSRGVGEDAIRCVLFDRNSGTAIAGVKKVLRVEGDTSPFDRCTLRLKELSVIAREYKANGWFCDRCNSHTVERQNRATKQTFRGCSNYPACDKRKPLNQKALLEMRALRYPLVDNPFVVESAEPVNPYSIKDLVRSQLKVDSSDEVVEPVIPQPPIVEPGMVYDIAAETELVPTSLYASLGYSFPYLNRMQSGVVKSGVAFQDCNFVLGTATSSGKTIAAELAIAAALKML